MSEKEKENLLLKIYNELLGFKQEMSNELLGFKQEMSNEQQKMNTTLNTVKEDLQSLTNTVTRMEYEYLDKFKIIFDAHTLNYEKLQAQNNDLTTLKEKVETHDNEIHLLKLTKEA